MSRIFEVSVPTNIAFLKYWGKRHEGRQWPANNSLSMTLSKWRTRCRGTVLPGARDHEFFFAGKALGRESAFAAKAWKQLDLLAEKTGIQDKLKIETENTFPTGCGVASSASSMAALTLGALCALLDCKGFGALEELGWSRQKIAELARLGSGSACRSFWGGYVLWEAGTQADDQVVRQIFSEDHWALTDTLVVFSEDPKKIPSSDAHRHAWSSLLFSPRLAGIPEKQAVLLEALEERSMKKLGPVLEAEALEMHSVMMTAAPTSCYLSRESVDFLAAFRKIRRDHGLDVYFTIDAGPNVHLIGEESEAEKLLACLRRDFPHLRLLRDRVGAGPVIRSLDREDL